MYILTRNEPSAQKGIIGSVVPLLYYQFLNVLSRRLRQYALGAVIDHFDD